MSDAPRSDVDEDLLEFLGGIDEANDEAQEGDFADFLANADVEKVAEKPASPKGVAPAKDGKSD
jgi:hypothetical protein